MAVIENASTEEGDVLRIRTDTPIVGLISLSQFVDTTTGEDRENYFKKEFRYSVDGGLTYSEWTELTLLNISGVSIVKYDSFVLEYKYTRVGSVPEVTLTFEDILVSGVIEDLPYPQYDKTTYKKFFEVNDLNVFGWALNVLEKLYTRGLILPNYMERGGDQSNLEDEDFITYWNSITHFFAIIVYFARQFQNFETNEILLTQFLKSKDLKIPNDVDLQTLLYIYGPTPLDTSHTYIDEYKKRGTLAILDQIAEGKEIDGELIRLIEHDVLEELIFALFRNYDNGWCLGKSSPLWKGTEKIVNVIKGYEYTEKVEVLANYPLTEPSFISIVTDKMALRSVDNAVFSGISGDTHKITVDPTQDYEISFRVSQTIKEAVLVFGARVWDGAGNELILKNVNTEMDTNYFFYGEELNIVSTDYWVRGILFNYLKPTQIGDTLNTGFGANMRLPYNAAKIVPVIGTVGTGSANIIKIDNVKVRPLKLNFSRGQLGIHNLIYMMSKNNNGELTDQKVEMFIKEKLIPYNSFLRVNWLADVIVPN